MPIITIAMLTIEIKAKSIKILALVNAAPLNIEVKASVA